MRRPHDHRPFDDPLQRATLGVIHEPERASPSDSEALWMLARLLVCVALAVSATLAAQVLTGAHPWAWWQVLSPLACVPTVVIAAAFVRAYLLRHHHG